MNIRPRHDRTIVKSIESGDSTARGSSRPWRKEKPQERQVEWATIGMGDDRISSHPMEWMRSYTESEPFSLRLLPENNGV